MFEILRRHSVIYLPIQNEPLSYLSCLAFAHIYLNFIPPPQCKVNPESGDPEDELTPDAIEFCRKVGSNATRVSEIAGGKDRAVHNAIQEGINAVNKVANSNAQRIQKWSILDRDFSVTGGELGEWSENTGCSLLLWLLDHF